MNEIPRTWHPIADNGEIDQIFESICLEADRYGYNPNVSLMLYSFTGKPWGTCRSFKKDDSYVSYIGLNKTILDHPEVVQQVLIHELAHACVPGEHHSRRWQAVGNKIGHRFGVVVHRCDNYEGVEAYKPKPAKYTITCQKCGMTYTRTRRSDLVIHPDYYRCGRCNSHKLVVT